MRRACPECRSAGALACTHRGPHGPQTVRPVRNGWLGLLSYRIDRLEDTGMCEKSSACGCTGTSAPPAAGIGAGIGKAVFTFIGGCMALVIAVGVFRLLEPWLITAGVITGGAYGTRAAIKIRRRLLARRPAAVTVPAPSVAELTPAVRAALESGPVVVPESWLQSGVVARRAVTFRK